MRLPFPLAFLCGLAALHFHCRAAGPDYPPLDAKTARSYERTWVQIDARSPNRGARDVYGFLLEAVAHQWRPERWVDIVARGEELHDLDPASPTYGNYRWYWREPKPNDRNAVEFSMQSASLTWAAYRDRLSPAAAEALHGALLLGAEGMLRHKVDVSYTNIFLMRLANCILIGERLDRPDLVARGRVWFDEWLAYTRTHGVHEFSSPTYYGTDLTDLGGLANFSQTPDIRQRALAALTLVWTDIAANWFPPYQGIAGAHSRDYGFLTGHGYLDQQLLRAGWITPPVAGESHAAIDDLTFWPPPASLRDAITRQVPRHVVQRWGADSWERATHYVGRTFTLGSAGSGYGAQDKVLTLTLDGGPKEPLVNFQLDYRHDPYGQTKMGTADGHEKLTHLLPLVATVQNGAEALLVASYDPAHSRNPAGGKAPITYAGIDATLVLPADVELSDGHAALAPAPRTPLPERVVFLRRGSTAAALAFVLATDDRGQKAAVAIVRDGGAVSAQRFSATLAVGTPRGRVAVAVWIRAQEGLADEASFQDFARTFLADAQRAGASDSGRIDVAVPARPGPLHIVMDPIHARRLEMSGGETVPANGILVVNGDDLGSAALRLPSSAR